MESNEANPATIWGATSRNTNNNADFIEKKKKKNADTQNSNTNQVHRSAQKQASWTNLIQNRCW